MNSYDVVVLDRDLPKVHGDAVCATLVGSRSAARILMLTAAGTVGDRVQGIEDRRMEARAVARSQSTRDSYHPRLGIRKIESVRSGQRRTYD